MRIIPAIDIIDGKCVRLTKGNYDTKRIYNENPLEVAKRYEDAGLKYLHLVDLDGAKSNCVVNQDILYKIASQTTLKIDFGGGIKSDEDIKKAFENGAAQITAGSVAIKNPEMIINWISTYGSHKIILGADYNNRKIATNGWLEQTEKDIISFIKDYEAKGITTTICTDIAKDGMLQGPALPLYLEIITATKIKLIASGGVSSFRDIVRLKEIGCEGAIIGKAIYEGKITLKELRRLC